MSVSPDCLKNRFTFKNVPSHQVNGPVLRAAIIIRCTDNNKQFAGVKWYWLLSIIQNIAVIIFARLIAKFKRLSAKRRIGYVGYVWKTDS